MSNRELKDQHSDNNDDSDFKISRPVSTQSVNIELRASQLMRTSLHRNNTSKKVLFMEKSGARPQEPSMIKEVDPEFESDSRMISMHRKVDLDELNKL